MPQNITPISPKRGGKTKKFRQQIFTCGFHSSISLLHLYSTFTNSIMDQLNIAITIIAQGTLYSGFATLQPAIQQPNNQPEPAPQPAPEPQPEPEATPATEPTPPPEQVQPQTQRQRRNIRMIQAAQNVLEEKQRRRREQNNQNQKACRERKKARLQAQNQTQ